MENKEQMPPLDGHIFPAGLPAERQPLDIETVRQAMQGDKDAFTALFLQTFRPMYYVARRFLQRDEDIYDALQNGYARAYQYLSRLQAPEAFFSWLKKIVENAARDIRAELLGQELVQEKLEEAQGGATADHTDAAERQLDIQEALDRLDPRQVEVLTLHYYDGMKLSEIARMLGEPPSTVRSRLAAAKKTLTAQLKSKGIDKSVYGGSISAMIAVSLRSLIGTDILSAATAQQMLDDILCDRRGHLGPAAYKLLEAQRNRTIFRAVSLLMSLTVAVTCLTVVVLNGIPWKTAPTVARFEPTISRTDAAATAATTISPTNTVDETGVPPLSTSTTVPEGDAGERSGTDTAPFPGTSGLHSGTSGTGTAIPFDGEVPGRSTKPTTVEITGGETTPTVTVPPAVFQPDYRPGRANTVMRNPVWRAVLHNRGVEYLDWQDEWVYSSHGYKFRRDGTSGKIPYNATGELLIDPVVWGDWIYYEMDGHKQIKRVRTDGGCVETIVEVSGRQEIIGFILRDNQLIYAVWEADGFGVSHYRYRSYSLATGEDQGLSLNGNFGFYQQLPVGDWFFDTFGFYACAFGREGQYVLKTLPDTTGNDWHGVRDDNGYFPAFMLGDQLYTSTGHCIDFSGEMPTARLAVSLNGLPPEERTAFRVEFVDETTGRLAVTLYDKTGVYPRSMRWYSEQSGWGKALPACLLRNTKYQTYQTSGDGWVFSTKADGTWFSCRMDGSDYREYTF